MAESKYGAGTTRRPWAEQYDDIKKVLDSIAYEIVQEADDADFYDTLDLKKVLLKADAKYGTFKRNLGYERLEMYNGVKNIKMKKKIKFNPYRWLRARKLGPDNEYFIREVYDGMKYSP